MKRKLFFLLLTTVVATALQAQLSLVKVIGKNAEKSKLGFGTFVDLDIPVGYTGTNSIVIELLDAAYIPPKTEEGAFLGYVSVKLGYRYIFSEESRTGFFLMPQLGYCRVVLDEGPEGTHGDGVAAALEAGYTVEVGQRGNGLNFGVKYERDMAGTDKTLSTVGLRISYSFNIGGGR